MYWKQALRDKKGIGNGGRKCIGNWDRKCIGNGDKTGKKQPFAVGLPPPSEASVKHQVLLYCQLVESVLETGIKVYWKRGQKGYRKRG